MFQEKIERQRRHFNNISGRYAEGRLDKNHIKIKKLIWSEIRNRLSYLRDKKINVLEPMCGFAEGKKILEKTLSLEINYEGFDYSDNVIHILNKNQPDIKVWQDNITRFKLTTSKKYDIIILIGGLHHIPDYVEIALDKLVPCLSTNGIFINLEPTRGNPLFKLIGDLIYRKNDIFDAQTERAFLVEELDTYFINAGLTKYYQYYPGLLAYILYYNPYAFPLLNIGNCTLVKTIFALDKLFMHNKLGRLISFATLGIWYKKDVEQ